MNGYDVESRDGISRARAPRRFGRCRASPRFRPRRGCRCAPDINMDGVLVPGPPRRRTTTRPRSTRSAVGADYFTVVGVPIVAGRAFTEDDVSAASAGSRSSTRRWRGSTGRTARRSASGSTAAASNRRRSRSSASRAITRCGRSARRRGPICTCPSAARRSIGLIVRTDDAGRSGAADAAPSAVDARAGHRVHRGRDRRAGGGDDGGADANRRDGARRVRRAGAAPGGGRPLRRHRLFGEPAHARGRHSDGARRGAAAGAADGARPGRHGSRSPASRSARSRPRASAGCSSRSSTASAGSILSPTERRRRVLLLVALGGESGARCGAARVDPVRALRNE